MVFNHAPVQENEWAIPSQMQLNTGIVVARTNVSPTLATPLDSTFALAQAASNASQTVTTTNTGTRANNGLSTSLAFENTSTWNASQCGGR